MRFETVIARQFFSHVESRLALANRGLILLTGTVQGRASASSNGAGKTSILLDAPLYALFGRTLRGARGDDVVRRQAGKNCLVELSLTTDAGEAVWIRRPQRHTQFSKPELTIGGETYRGAAEVERLVTEVLGLTFSGVTNSLFLGKGCAYFTQLTDAARKDLLEELLSLEDLTRCAAVVAARKQQWSAGIQLARQAVQQHTHAVQTYQEAEQAARRQVEAFAQHTAVQHATARAQLQAASQRVAAAEAAWQRLQADEPSPALRQAAQHAKQEAQAQADRVQSAQTALQHLLCERAGEHDRLRKEQQRIDTLSGDCPTCWQPIREVHLNRCRQEMATRLQRAQAQWDAVDGALLDLHPLVHAAQCALQQATKDEETVQAQYQDWQRQGQSAQQDCADAAAQQQAAEQMLSTFTAQSQLDDAHLRSLQQRCAQEEAALREASERVQALETFGAFLDFWDQAFSNAGIKHRVLSSVMPYLNARAAHYSHALTDGTTVVEFATETTLKGGGVRDKFDVQVRSLDAGGSYVTCSDGQRRRADLICTLALGDLVNTRARNTVDLLVVDEIVDGLDPVGIERLLQVFAQMTETRSSIWCISHNQRLAAHFPTVVNVVQEHGVSRIWDPN